jgi:hypothetical protein
MNLISKGLIVSAKSIIEKMTECLLAVNVISFGSRGWIHRFLKRYSLVSRRITGSGRLLATNAGEIIWDYILEANDFIFEKGS